MLMPAPRRHNLHNSSPMPRRWAILGGALGVVVTLFVQAPAAWLASALERATDGKVALVDPSGTFWSGSAHLQLSGGQGSQARAALPGRLDWQARPSWAGLQIALSAACCTSGAIHLAVSPRWGGLFLRVQPGLQGTTPPVRLPASLLEGLGSPWNTLQFDGQLALSFQGLSVEWIQGRASIAGQAELVASGMSSRLSTLKPMGSYRITLTGGQTTRLELATIDGSLQLSGTGQWVGSRLRFTGEASAAPDREAALSNLLNIIGRRNGARSIISIG